MSFEPTEEMKAAYKMSMLNNCSQCGEDAVLVTWNSNYLVRVRRKSKCKKPNGYKCQTWVHTSEKDAIEHWNQGNPNPSLIKKDGEPIATATLGLWRWQRLHKIET